MFVAGMSSIVEPASNDIWTIPGEEALPAQWRQDDEALFRRIDPTSYFHTLQFADFADAIRAGSNIVRVGTAIFGARDYTK